MTLLATWLADESLNTVGVDSVSLR